MAQNQTIYLDYAATTPIDSNVIAVMAPFQSDLFYNPSATYQAAREVRQSLEAARTSVAATLGTRSSEIIFTAGGSEANNLAIHGIMRRYPTANVVVSAIEHEAVLAPAGRYDCRQVKVTPQGQLDINELRNSIDDNTVLISIMYANNEVGSVLPVKAIGQLIADVRHHRRQAGNDLPIYLHTDACQAANYLDLHVAKLGVDMMSLNGSKIYGPKQSGCLYVKGGLRLKPLIDGGGQERGLRSGTENIAGAVGFATALELAQKLRRDEVERLQPLQQLFITELGQALPTAIINGPKEHRLPNNVHVTLPDKDNERLLILLDEAGIMAAAGSACSASSQTPSHVLRAMGLSDQDAQASLRFTMGRQTTAADVKKAIQVLKIASER